MRITLAYAWYRFRSTFASQRSFLASVVVLVGLLGGLSIASLAGARTTESSFADYASSVHLSQLYVLDGVINPGIGLDSAYNPGLLNKLSRLPHVARVESTVELNLGPLSPNGVPLPNSAEVPPAEASVGGLDYNEDPLIITAGRMADPHRSDEVVIDQTGAKLLGYHVGERITVGWVTNQQTSSGNFSPGQPAPVGQRAQMTVVGISEGQASTLFHDQDAVNGGSILLFTPAFTNKLLDCCSNAMTSGLTLQDGDRYLSSVESEVRSVLPKGLPFVYVQSADVIATANATLRPEAIALAVFGGIAGLATLLIAGQIVSRRVRFGLADVTVARALGATPSMTLWDPLLGTLGAVVVGAVVAGVVALVLSPLAPLGPVGPILGFALRPDWAVTGAGVAVLALSLGAVAVVSSAYTRPDRARSRLERIPSSRVTTAATRASLPPAAVTGVQFALEPGSGRSTVPVRSAILGAILAVIVVVTTVTFGSSLSTLVTHPSLYGWNWNYDIDGGGGLGDVPGQAAAALLRADPYVQSWTGVYFSTLSLDGQSVPVMGTPVRAAVAPPLLSGHELAGPDEVVLGPATLRSLHKQVGDSVEMDEHNARPLRLTIVGTATLPPIGVVGSSHLEMGTGAIVAFQHIPPAARNLFEVTPGPNAILVRTKGGFSAAALHSLQEIGRKVNIAINGGSVLSVQRPAEILNYGSLGTTPLLLGAALAVGASVALGLTLVTSVRRRRRDLAVLKTLGFTGRQLAAAVGVQACVAALIGCVIGIPVGIALGRVLWNLFAREISAVPVPTVPIGTVVTIAFAAIALAILIATVPGRIAARTSTAQLLRVE